MIRLLALVQKAEGLAPNQRFRLEQWSPHLAADHGIFVEFAPFESPELTAVLYERGRRALKARLALRDALRRWDVRSRVREFDAVVVLREATLVGPPWLEEWIAARRPLIYDFDDAIWQVDVRGRNGFATLARMPWKVGRICRAAAAVTVGNAYLAAYARRFNHAVHIVRTSIDTDRFAPAPPPSPDVPFTVAWTGSHSTLPHLETLRPALERLATERVVRLRVVCDVPPAPLRGVAVDFRRWSPGTEASDLHDAHVGVMPLPDSAFARGKCGCKALQYMAVGRAAVVSPVGINTEIVRDGVNGLLADGDDAWVGRLRALAADPAFRDRLAAAGLATVRQGFTARASAAAFARVVHEAVAASPGRHTAATTGR